MARNRWTLALIIICLPILATVITAFRIRDLPKSHDPKVETKQPCEQCDVNDQKVHSAKIESDKSKLDELKKAVREKQQLINEKKSATKPTHTFVIKSNEDDDDDNLEFPDLQTGFRQEKLKDSKLSKGDSKIKPIITAKKISINIDDDDDDNDDDDEDNDNSKSTINKKSKIIQLKKPNDKLNYVKRSVTKVVAKKQESVTSNDSDDEDDDDDDDDDGDNDGKGVEIKKLGQITLKTKVTDVKRKSEIPKKESKTTQSKLLDKKTQKDDDDGDDDDDDDDDSDSDNDDDDADDNYKGLDNIDELFKILDMKPGAKLKQDVIDKKTKTAHHLQTPKTEAKTEKDSKIDDNDDDDDSDDDNDNDDGDEDANKKGKLSAQKTNKPTSLSKGPKPKVESTPKTTETKSDKLKKVSKSDEDDDDDDDDDEDADENDDDDDNSKNAIKQLKTKQSSPSKAEKQKVEEKSDKIKTETKSSSKDTKEKKQVTDKEGKHSVKVDEKDIKSKRSTENKKVEAIKTEEKVPDKKKDDHTIKSSEKVKSGDKEKSQSITKDEKDKKSAKPEEGKLKSDLPIKTKESDKETLKQKSPDKDSRSSSHEEKKLLTSTESKKDQTDHKHIFTTPTYNKDIKYDFEKPNAYKHSQQSFDYSEFEKMQVTKSPHKEMKKPKSSAETVSDSREERYLKHVTDALNRRNLLKSEFEDFYAFLPTFAPNFSRIHNPECRRHGQILLRQLRGTKLWALNMLDATAKIPSGVLQGNGIQLGDFDQCLGSRARVQLDGGSVVKVQGKYCLARLDVKAEHSELEAPVYLAQAKSLIRSRIDDPGHFVPRFSTLSWGVCVPAACGREDVEVIVKDALKHYQHKSGLQLKVKVDEDDCHTDEAFNWDEWLELPTLLTLLFYGVILLLVLVATVQDLVARRQPEEGQEEEEANSEQKDKENEDTSKKQSDGILSPFSLYRTINKLFAPGTTDEIACIHGIRGIATVALLVAHKFMPVAVMPYTNRVKITEVASSPLWSWCRAGWIFTDCFLLLSGTLTSHRMTSDDTGAVRRLFSRYLRLTPALLAVVLFYAFVWDKLSTGPMWGTFVTKNAEICEKSWWWNLLYLQNYFGLEDMCAPQTHQLALDMQLTIFGSIIVWVSQSGLSFGKLLLPAVHLVSAYFRYTTVRDHRLTLLAYHGVSVSQLYRTARLSYTSTLHRCSPYLIGISLGLALQKPSKHGKFLLTLGWLTSIGLSGLVIWSGIDSGSTQYRYNATYAAQYATIAPLASAMAMAWVIYAVHSGTCDFLSRVFCWRPLVFISRLSYALYLCQFIIFITNIGTVRNAKEFTLMSLIDAQEILAILLSSIVLTVTFVIPMQSLHKVFSFNWKSETEESSEKEQDEPNETAEVEPKVEEKKDITPPAKSRHNLVAHREMLEEIPEQELEYETQRENIEGLDEIVEEEEGMGEEEEEQIDDLEIIEEEEAGEEEAWMEREGERSHSRQEDHDLDEWEWTANDRGRSGAQYYRYAR